VRGFNFCRIDFRPCITGTIPASFARLDTLVILRLSYNKLAGTLPPHIGSDNCLPSLKTLLVHQNPDLGGELDPAFLALSDICDVTGCDRQRMRTPFLSGVSFSSQDIGLVFAHAPQDVLEPSRLQPVPEWEEGYEHSLYGLIGWHVWQKVWLRALRAMREGRYYVFCVSKSFKEKYERPSSEEEHKVALAHGHLPTHSHTTIILHTRTHNHSGLPYPIILAYRTQSDWQLLQRSVDSTLSTLSTVSQLSLNSLSHSLALSLSLSLSLSQLSPPLHPSTGEVFRCPIRAARRVGGVLYP
jgi:hypothetical protein